MTVLMQYNGNVAHRADKILQLHRLSTVPLNPHLSFVSVLHLSTLKSSFQISRQAGEDSSPGSFVSFYRQSDFVTQSSTIAGGHN